ncbi:MAG: DUF1573 domain-containing protein [bacterium]|nr:DUF1573 domain-containing protein [bacterium]
MKGKNRTLIIAVIGAAVLAGGVFWAAGGSGSKTASAPDREIPPVASAISILQNDWDFGEISMKDGDVVHNFEMKNEGTEPVVIKKVFTSCMCTTALIKDASGNEYGKFGMPGHGLPSKTDVVIGPGETAIVEAVYDPAAHGPAGVGLARRSIYLETNSSVSPKVEVRFSALVSR